MYQLKPPQDGALRKKLLIKLDKKKGREWQIDNDQNIKRLLRSRLLDFNKNAIQCKGKSQVILSKSLRNACEKIVLKDTHREKAPSNKAPALTKSTNMGIWVVGTRNQLFIRGS